MTTAEWISRFEAECDKKPNSTVLRVLCEHMADYLHTHPGAAELIKDDKTLDGAIDKMKAAAKKSAANGVGVLSDEEGFAIVHSYFGIDAPEEQMETISYAAKAKRRAPVSLFDI